MLGISTLQQSDLCFGNWRSGLVGAKHRRGQFSRLSSFSLLEVLVVVAVIGLLVAILVPAVGQAQSAARRGKVKVQFAQWAAGLSEYRAEYGCYPNFSTTTTVPLPVACRINDVPGLFFQTMVASREDGIAPDQPRALSANPRRIQFLSFTAEEVGPGLSAPIRDACGNTDIVVMIDRDGDGLIVPPSPLPTVTSAETGRVLAPDPAVLPASGVRGEVLFYSAGTGVDGGSIVYSWQ